MVNYVKHLLLALVLLWPGLAHADYFVQQGSRFQCFDIYIQREDNGRGFTGLTPASAGLQAWYHRETMFAALQVNLVPGSMTGWVTGGFNEVNATKMPGAYKFCVPDAVIASGANSAFIVLSGVANMRPAPIRLRLGIVACKR